MASRIALLLIGILGAIPALFDIAYGQSCFETATCSVDPFDPLSFIMRPLLMTFSDWIYLIVWGMIIFYIWIRTGSPLYAGFVGVIISSSLTASSTVLESLAPAMQMATILLACSFGLCLYAVFRRGVQGQ